MSKYLITLTPTGKFFFGGDMTFQVGDKANDDFNSQFSSYIIKSNKFPQQTSLLGMLRFLILRNDITAFDGTKICNPAKAKQLIGNSSFVLGSEGDFKAIKSIEPCFIMKEGEPIQLLARDYKLNVKFESSKGSINENAIDIPTIENYDSKEGITTLYLADDVEVPESDIFVEDFRMGIDKDYSGKTKDAALFKQICYRLNDKVYEYEKPEYDSQRKRKQDDDKKDNYVNCQYQFAFHAVIDNNVCPTFKSYDGQIVSIGGDSSQFIIGISNEEKNYEVAAKEIENRKKIILQSPTYLTKDDIEAVVDFAITNTIPFKCMKTTVDGTKDYNRKSRNEKVKDQYSEKLYLYDTGSVFYVQENNLATFKKAIENHKDFRQIGYNHYTIK